MTNSLDRAAAPSPVGDRRGARYGTPGRPGAGASLPPRWEAPAQPSRPAQTLRLPQPGGAQTSSLPYPHADARTPSPGSGERGPLLPPSPRRGRAQAPAGGAASRSAPSAGISALAAAMSEDRGPDSLDAHVRKLMKDLGLTGFHVEKSLDVEKNRKNVSVKGWPDWTIRGPRGVLFRELKSQRGRVAPEQQAWLDALTAAGADAGVWRPADLLSGAVAAELAALAGRRAAGGAA